MKLIFTILITLFTISNTSAAPVIRAIANSGNWSSTLDWDLSRIPQDQDTIVIPVGLTITMGDNITLNGVVLQIFGTLKFTNGKINLDSNSLLLIETGGTIDGSGNNDQIRYNNVTMYKGTYGDISGPIMLNSTSGFQPLSLLPVTFVSFNARKEKNKIILTWVTDNEINNNHFVVERCVNGTEWNPAGVVLATFATGTNRYEFKDELQKAIVINYRIRQVDIDGKFMYSKVQSIRINESVSSAKVFASSKNMITVQFSAPLKSIAQVRVFTANGKKLKQVAATAQTDKLNIPVNNGSGAYIVQWVNDNGAAESKQVIL